MAEDEINRRSLLSKTGTLAVSGVALLAGCNSDSDDGGQNNEDETPTPTEGMGFETDESTETEEVGTEGSSGTPSAERFGGEMIAGQEAAPTGFDPHNIGGDPTWRTNHNIYQKVIDRGDEIQMIGRLAKSWEVSDDRMSHKATLREGVQFQEPEGGELTADDVVYTWNRLLSDESNFQGGLTEFDSVEKTGEYEVEWHLNVKSVPALQKQFFGWVLPEDAADNYNLNETSVGTGPFSLEEFVSNNKAVLTKHENYWETDENGAQLPYLDQVELRAIPEPSSRATNLQSGTIQQLFKTPSSQFEKLQDDDNVKTYQKPSSQFIHILLNTRLDKLSDKRLRQAIAHSFSREEIVDAGYFGFATPTTKGIHPLHPIHGDVQAENVREKDLDKAQELVEESDYDGETINIAAAQSHAGEVAGAEIMQSNLEEIGVTAQVELVDQSTWVSDIRFAPGFDFDVAFTLQGGRVAPAALYQFWTPDSGRNSPGFDNEEFNSKVQEMASEFDNGARAEIATELEEILWEEVPIIPVLYANSLGATTQNVEGYKLAVSTAWSQRFKNVWFSE